MLDRNKEQKRSCVKSSAACIQWDLGDIPCLGIKNGDMLDDITFAIVRKICERQDEFDLDSITLTELVERFNITEPAEKTVHTLLQLCVDNDVRLHKLFTALRDSIPGASGGFVLDLKCFKQLDSYGNQVPYDEQTVLQDLINEACTMRDEFEDMKEIVDAIGDGEGGVYIEPIINETCPFDEPTAPLRTSAYLARFASAYCQYKSKVGSVAEINIGIGKQSGSENMDSGWNERFISDPNFIQFPQNMAQSENNQWMAINNMNSRLEEMEACACKVTCKDLTIGFGVTNTDSGVILEFAPQYGNSVNEAFTLTGDNNKVSFTDKNGKRMTFNITSLKNEDTAGPFDITRLAQDGIIDVNVCIGMTTPTGEFCNRCVQDQYDPNTNNCNFCEIRASEPVVIIYKSCSTDDNGVSQCVNKALRLGAGEDAAIRKSYAVTYISNPDAVQGLECLNFGEYEGADCFIYWTAKINSSSIVPAADVVGIKFKGNEYMFDPITPNNMLLHPELAAGKLSDKISTILNVKSKWTNANSNTNTYEQVGSIEVQMSPTDAKDLYLIQRYTYNDQSTPTYSFAYAPFVPRTDFGQTTAISILDLPTPSSCA